MMRRLWDTATYGSVRPGRMLAALAALGAIAGFGETLVVLLIVALVSGGQFASTPLAGVLPSSETTLALLALGVVAVLAAAHFFTARLTAQATAEAQGTLQRRLTRAYLSAQWTRQAQSPVGELQDLATVKVGVLAYGTQGAAVAVAALVNMLVVLVASVLVSPFAAVALLVAVGLVLALARPLRGLRQAVIERFRTTTTDLALDVTEKASLSRDLRIFGVGGTAYGALETKIAAAQAETRAVRMLMLATGPLTRDATLAVLVVGLGLVVTQADIGLPALASTVVLMLRALAHAQAINGYVTQFDERALNVAAMKAKLAEWETDAPAGSTPCPAVDRLALTDVTVTYEGHDVTAVRDASLELRRGEMLGIVGRTGAGKSTLASLLLGLLTADAGRITVDGVPLADLDPADWHARTAWVGQEPRLLTGTVGENVAFLRPSVTREIAARAAERAGLATELAAWPDGLDHNVGPAGAALSGGERQRVALARALAGDPDLLVLDEPTSALDSHTEEAVRRAVADARHDRIVVVIAHRLSTLRACDRIAVMAGGRIEDVAAPGALERDNRFYREALAASRP